jgi:adenine-specific DNA-methyltransferase
MTFIALKPRKALNKAFLKVKPNRTEIDTFKANLIQLLDQINEKESEEFHKNIVSKFLDATYYSGNHYINTKGRNDLVIHNGKDAKTSVGVIVEAKKPAANKSEMLRVDNLNSKAFHELVLYYLRERITGNNIEIKYVVATNIYEWFIFDAEIFDKAFAQDKDVVKRFTDFEEKRLSGTTTDFFYKEIAEPAVAELLKGDSKAGKNLSYTHFDIRDIEKKLRNSVKEDDNDLIPVYKLFSPEHLLKLPFKNDSNSLDKGFYAELLHIIGLTEVKDGGKKLIDRKDKGDRDEGSFLENTITQLDTLDKVSRLERPSAFGSTNEARFFNVGLELVITWINRILFLKLLEAQLVAYHKGDKSYAFLNTSRVKNFDDLNSLFFQVLAKQADERGVSVKEVFGKVPYLNSSLFEPTELEHSCLFISQLQENKELPIISSTVLKDNNGKKKTGKLNVLQYLFEFLNAYDFSSEGSEDIQEENKTLISASVLGLIFEKINGYKDGSFFTPGFITMYMCRETIRRTIIQKFNDAKGWKCTTIEEVYDKIDDKKEANTIINSLKICDPAVGSGHFLVSALNEIIAAKSDLKILLDRDGKTLRDYHVEVSNDELAITDEEGMLFEYNPKNKESQRIQETLFHEKQTIIENCLFGVDINPNSVKICRLRLWIELLKNAYYKSDSNFSELETLPNIDINIKCGNSIISRFPLDVDLSQALKKAKITIKSYKQAVQNYRHAESKEQKREMEQLIASIKTNFRTEISNNDSKVKKLSGKRGELDNLLNQHSLFELSKSEQKERAKNQKKLQEEIEKLESQIEEIKNNKIFENAFEWRFEFPEALNDSGDFVGFDTIIGNPPYGTLVEESAKNYFKEIYRVVQGPFEVYKLFIERGLSLLAKNRLLCFISPDTWTNLSYFKALRNLIYRSNKLETCTQTLYEVFDEATVDTNIYIIRNIKSDSNDFYILDKNLNYVGKGLISESEDDVILSLKVKPKLIEKIEHDTFPLSEVVDVWRGMSAYGAANPDKPYNSNKKESEFHRPVLNGGDISKYSIKWSGEYIKYGEWLHRPRPAYIYDRPHLLIQRIRNPRLKDRIVATYDDEKYISSDGLSNLILGDETKSKDYLKYILGIINSKVINYWFSFYYFDVNIKPEQIRRIPLKKGNGIFEKKLITLVDQMLNSNGNKAGEKYEERLKEIDQLVYKLYELDDSDIEIIESV